MLARAEARRLGAALAAVAEPEDLGEAGEHPGPAAGEARGCAGRGRRRAEIRAGWGELSVFWVKEESKKGKEHEYGHDRWEKHL